MRIFLDVRNALVATRCRWALGRTMVIKTRSGLNRGGGRLLMLFRDMVCRVHVRTRVARTERATRSRRSPRACMLRFVIPGSHDDNIYSEDEGNPKSGKMFRGQRTVCQVSRMLDLGHTDRMSRARFGWRSRPNVTA